MFANMFGTTNTKQKWIVYFASGNYWTGGLSGRHHLLSRLKSDYRILFINSLGLASVTKVKKSTVLTRIKAKLLSYAKYVKKDSGYTIFSPISIPLGLTVLEHFNTFLLKLQIRIALYLLGIARPHILVASPKATSIIGAVDYDCLIYMYSDKFSAYREIANRDYIESLDSSLKSKATYIVSNLYRTYEDLSQSSYSSKSFYLPHSVDFDLFNSALHKAIPIPQDMPDQFQPIVGYYGTLTNSNDWDLIKFLSRKRPKYKYVFIGKPRSDIDHSVFELDNVFFLGYKPYNVLPHYLKYFSVCLMFWKPTEWIYNSNPLKTKEFLAMGKPIVSVRIYELEKNFHNLIYHCDTYEDYLESLDRAIQDDSLELQERRISSVSNDSWDKDASRIREILEMSHV